MTSPYATLRAVMGVLPIELPLSSRVKLASPLTATCGASAMIHFPEFASAVTGAWVIPARESLRVTVSDGAAVPKIVAGVVEDEARTMLLEYSSDGRTTLITRFTDVKIALMMTDELAF